MLLLEMMPQEREVIRRGKHVIGRKPGLPQVTGQPAVLLEIPGRILAPHVKIDHPDLPARPQDPFGIFDPGYLLLVLLFVDAALN